MPPDRGWAQRREEGTVSREGQDCELQDADSEPPRRPTLQCDAVPPPELVQVESDPASPASPLQSSVAGESAVARDNARSTPLRELPAHGATLCVQPAPASRQPSTSGLSAATSITTAFREDRRDQAGEITQAEYLNYQRMFKTYDTDGSGTIDALELGKIMSALGQQMSAEDLASLIAEADTDGSGLLEFPEFVELMSVLKERLLSDDRFTTADEQAKRYIREALRTKLPLLDSPVRWLLDFCVFLAIFYYTFSVPYRLVHDGTGGLPALPENVFIIEGACHVVFLADILLCFRTMPRLDGDEARHVDLEPAEVARRYLRGWFLLDFLTALPVDIIVPERGSAAGWVFRGLKLLKIARVPKLFSGSGGRRIMTAEYIILRYSIVPVVRLLYWLVLLVHWCSVGYLLLREDVAPCGQLPSVAGPRAAPDTGPPAPASSSPATRGSPYIEALYLVLYTLTTVGYGDVELSTNSQRFFMCFLFVAGAAINGFVISKINRVLSSSNIASERKSKMVEMVGIMSFFKIPSHIQHEILSFQNHLLEQNLGSAYSEIMESLPAKMKEQLSLYVRLKFISRVPFFRSCHDECKQALAQSLENTVAQPREFIICAGELGDEMYFLGHGVAQVLAVTGKHLSVLRRGNFFGEIALLSAMQDKESAKRAASVRALTYCDLFCLTKQSFLDILNRFPKFRKVIDKEAKRRRKSLAPPPRSLAGPAASHSGSSSSSSGASAPRRPSAAPLGAEGAAPAAACSPGPSEHSGNAEPASWTPPRVTPPPSPNVLGVVPPSGAVPRLPRSANKRTHGSGSRQASFQLAEQRAPKPSPVFAGESHSALRRPERVEAAATAPPPDSLVGRIEHLEQLVGSQQTVVEARFAKIEHLLTVLSVSSRPSSRQSPPRGDPRGGGAPAAAAADGPPPPPPAVE
eukprot:TRINITY_DN4818_c0_g5_i1.p1 TRINITY_DN4818_c0_g5~~TRINITY_DN4818_c0_g5_i1.p1  ORF type:complete len:944 (+),score=322.86 TRINITY_DN4818_c0_g5_i1:75-2834(+)